MPETLKDAFGPVYEKQLKKTGTGFIVGNKVSITHHVYFTLHQRAVKTFYSGGF